MALTLENQSFSDALVILGAAGLVIPLFARFNITPVVGFLLVGIAVGPYALGSEVGNYPWLYYVTISDPEAIAPFAELGIILLLFSIGMELSFGRLWALRRHLVGLGGAELIGGAFAIALGLMWMGMSQSSAIGLALALSLSSTALVLPISGTRSAVGKSALSMLLFEDLAIVPIIFALGALAPVAGRDADPELLLGIALRGIAVIGGIYLVGRIVLPRLFAQAARTKNHEVFLAASLLVVITSSLATAAVGLSPIVGALLAGMLIAGTPYHHEVETVTGPFKGLALGVFLISVGMAVDLRYISDNLWPILLALIAVIATKSLVVAALLRLARARRGVAAEVALLMASPSETTLIVLAAAIQAGVITFSEAQFWTTLTAIGLTITPLLARAGREAARRIETREALADETEPLENRVLIVGYGRIGRVVADMLERHEIAYEAIDADIDEVGAARRAGRPVRFGDVSRGDALTRLGLADARAVVLTMDDTVQQERIAAGIRAIAPDLPIVSRARDSENAARLYDAGVSQAVPETVEASLQLAEVLLVELGKPMGPVIASIHERRAEMRSEIQRLIGAERRWDSFRARRSSRDRAGNAET